MSSPCSARKTDRGIKTPIRHAALGSVDAAVQVRFQSLSTGRFFWRAWQTARRDCRVSWNRTTPAPHGRLKTFGATVRRDGDVVSITGVEALRPDIGTIDMGAGGTPARFMLALASLTEGPVSIDGSTRLRERPMSELIEMLRELGAEIEPLGKPGHLPVRIHPGRMKGGRLEIAPQASSQFVSALMLIAPRLDAASNELHRCPRAGLHRLTISELKAWSAELTNRGAWAWNIQVAPGGSAMEDGFRPASSAYWACWPIILGSRIELVGLEPADGQPDHQAIAAPDRSTSSSNGS